MKYRAVGLLVACGALQAEPLPAVCQGEFTEARVTAALPREVQAVLDGRALADQAGLNGPGAGLLGERFLLGAVNSDCVVVATERPGRGPRRRARVFTHGPGGWSETYVESAPYAAAPRSKDELLAAFR